MRKFFFLAITLTALSFSACKKSTDTLALPSINDFFPLLPGKYITYNLDSTVYLNFGTVQAIRSYQVKHVVDALITDNLGRPAYRIIRYIRRLPTDPWSSDNTFMAVPTDFALEFIENNFRFLKLKAPIRNGFSWKGNTYIDTYSLNSNVKYLDDWDYSYDSLYLPSRIGATNIDSTLTINQRDEVIGNPTNPSSYSERNFGAEKYAKGIGLVYRKFLHTEYQPPTPGHPIGTFSDGSYGVTLTMIDHN